MPRNVLFVTEGKREIRLLKRLIDSMGTFSDYEAFSYNANLHKMLEGMSKGGVIDPDIDFIGYLKTCKTNHEDRDALQRKFTDIFLIFDMDPQDPKYDPDLLKKALEYFNDSTDNGKLYINYPMLESYRHISNLDDLSFLYTKVESTAIRGYKEIANRDGIPELSDISKIDHDIMLKIVILNLRKAH